ncbi:MAG TPA: hypothetical protein VGD21_13335 [Lysobacter sp.]
MHDDVAPNKTDAGRDEIRQRSRRLPSALRSILLLVDGQRTVGQLRGVIAGLHAPVDALEQLVGMGLVEDATSVASHLQAAPAASVGAPSPGAISHYGVLYALMSDAVREHLGLRGYFLQLKIERCSNAEELLAVLPDLAAALGKVRDFAVASEFEQRLRTLAQA